MQEGKVGSMMAGRKAPNQTVTSAPHRRAVRASRFVSAHPEFWPGGRSDVDPEAPPTPSRLTEVASHTCPDANATSEASHASIEGNVLTKKGGETYSFCLPRRCSGQSVVLKIVSWSEWISVEKEPWQKMTGLQALEGNGCEPQRS